jgi:hypothetical protein
MELFWAEKVGEIEGNSIIKCRACDQNLELVRAIIVDSEIIRLFECRCGEFRWDARLWEE